MAKKIGFIGLGLMGRPMARNLIGAGYDLTVHNRSRGPVDELVKEGAMAANAPSEVAAASDVTITMLPGPAEVRKIVAGEGGVLEGAAEGSLVVDMSTSSPLLASELDSLARKKSVGALDAPVSGGDVGAQQGTLSIMAGGAERDFSRAKPVFGAMGRTIVHVGEAGTGQTVKACNQVVVALTIEAVSEALVLGAKAGVEAEKILEVLGGGLASNKVMEVKREKLLSGDFTPGGKADSQHKDLGLALEAARGYGVALPLTAVVDQMYAALRARGGGSLDHSALVTLLEDLSGG